MYVYTYTCIYICIPPGEAARPSPACSSSGRVPKIFAGIGAEILLRQPLGELNVSARVLRSYLVLLLTSLALAPCALAPILLRLPAMAKGTSKDREPVHLASDRLDPRAAGADAEASRASCRAVRRWKGSRLKHISRTF